VLRKKKEKIEEVLDRKVVDTKGGNHIRYLVKWEGLPKEYITWITKGKLKSLNKDKLKNFEEEHLQKNL